MTNNTTREKIMARLTAVVDSESSLGRNHKEVHIIGHFLENDKGEVVYSDGEVIDKDDLQGFIADKADEYEDLLKEDGDRLGTSHWGMSYSIIIHSAEIEYGINDVTEKLGYLRDYK